MGCLLTSEPCTPRPLGPLVRHARTSRYPPRRQHPRIAGDGWERAACDEQVPRTQGKTRVSRQLLQDHIQYVSIESITYGFRRSVHDHPIATHKRHINSNLSNANKSKTYPHPAKLLHSGDSQPASADDFLPMLIYVLLRTNPEHFKANLLYVRAFKGGIASFFTLTSFMSL